MLTRIWRYGRWALLALVLAYVALVIYRMPSYYSEQETADAVAAIHAQRLTMRDVDGSNLPPAPDPQLADATVEGVDANENGIRDDVELEIFKRFKDLKLRAAALQYARAVQLEYTFVFNADTLKAAINEQGRGYLCLNNEKQATAVEGLIQNSTDRIAYREELRSKYMSSFSLDSTEECDLTI